MTEATGAATGCSDLMQRPVAPTATAAATAAAAAPSAALLLLPLTNPGVH
eukprot:CAMPEP_0172932646 /NCGR_PEP_ID=MMETSP1075-20121228/220105_1 /TAXON_ID=2916 /ORGANISM="Ceratium fusus, Strain PA161109" /LENGTH=49 /DNA_ID=CAMNT_0013793977 /DNA_START=77 /DNA_END=226 /DNA_ORIENTATION=-